jgi:hypothetical protein
VKTLTSCLMAALLFTTPLAAKAQGAGDASDLRLQLEHAQLLINTNISKAFLTINRLKSEYPNNPNVIAVEADAYEKVGDLRRARLLMDQAKKLAPNDEDIAEQYRAIYLQTAPSVSLDGEIRDTSHEAIERMVTLSANNWYAANPSFGFKISNDDISTHPLLFSDGTTRRTSRQRQLFEGYALFDRTNSEQGKLKLYAANGIVGVGGEYRFYDSYGWTLLEANYHRPDWDDFIISIVDEGTKDNAKISRTQRITENLTGSIGAGVNNYGLSEDDSLATSWSVEAQLAYDFDPAKVRRFLGQGSQFGLNYNLDAEYKFHVDTLHNLANPSYRPLPLTDRQIHSFTVDVSKEFATNWLFSAYGGYEFDLLGSNAPEYGGSLKYLATDALSFDLRASRGILPEQSHERVDEIGLNITYKFF